MIRILQNIFELIYFERARRDLSIGGVNLFTEPKLDFIWIFEISAVLNMSPPVLKTVPATTTGNYNNSGDVLGTSEEFWIQSL